MALPRSTFVQPRTLPGLNYRKTRATRRVLRLLDEIATSHALLISPENAARLKEAEELLATHFPGELEPVLA